MKTTTVTITDEQHAWVQEVCMNLSARIRKMLDEEMKKSGV